MANKKIKIFALENREGFWGRFHDARLPGESRAPIKLLTRDESLPNFVINQLWEKKNEELKRERGILPDIKNPLSSAIIQWHEHGCPSSRRSNKKQKTLDFYKRTTDLYLEAIGDHDLDEYSWEHASTFEKFLWSLPRITDEGVNCHQRQFQIFITWCHSTGKLKHLIKPPKVSKSEKLIETFTRKQIEIYKEATFAQGDINLNRTFMLCYYNIMRMSEVWTLPLDQIIMNTEPPRIVIKKVEDLDWLPKMGKPRENELHNQTLVDFLIKDLGDGSSNRKWFLDKGNGERDYERYGHLTERFGDIRDRAGLPKYAPLQTLRRTGITLMVEAGATMAEVHDHSGHHNISTTEKYYRAKRRRSGSKAASVL